MKRHRFSTTVLLFAIACCVVSQVAVAQLLSNADNGLSERLYGRSAGLGTDSLRFFWEPELPLNSTTFGLVGICNRIDLSGSLLGTHTATFENVTLVGVDSENSDESILTATSEEEVLLAPGFLLAFPPFRVLRRRQLGCRDSRSQEWARR